MYMGWGWGYGVGGSSQVISRILANNQRIGSLMVWWYSGVRCFVAEQLNGNPVERLIGMFEGITFSV